MMTTKSSICTENKVNIQHASNVEDGYGDMEAKKPEEDKGSEDLPCAVISSFNCALKNGRVRIGLCESFALLDLDPLAVVMCLLPHLEEKDDPLKHMHILLVEAFCQEHGVRFAKVTSMDGFCALLKLAQRMGFRSPYDVAPPTETGDLLIIQNSYTKVCMEDERLKHLYDKMFMTSGAMYPFILPAIFPRFFET